MSQPENGQEYGVGSLTALDANSRWIHWRCDKCGACSEQPVATAQRPPNWVKVVTYTSKGQMVTELCASCAQPIAKLMVWDDG